MSDPNQPDWKTQLAASLEAFKNRKRYETLNPEILRSVPDADVEQAIIDFIEDRTKLAGGDTRQALDALSDGFRAVYATWWVEAEVNNGGFNQYFWNASGAFACDAVAGFDRIGLPQLARLMERAIAIRNEDAHEIGRFKDRGTLEAFSESYENNRLNDLDQEFYALEADVSAARIRFIRDNAELFRGTSAG
ncbi:MAG: DMP19 family protein [Polyangiaceae bacterium]